MLIAPSLASVNAERLDDARRHGEGGLDARVVHIERRCCIERQSVAEMGRNHLVSLPALLEGEIFICVDLRAADPERGEAALRMAGDADPLRVDLLPPGRIVQQ